ncbi:MAG: hypothetical protein WCV90_02250 [Candidatus Woesearchaeota archaeon]|jgi:hypothetical protein
MKIIDWYNRTSRAEVIATAVGLVVVAGMVRFIVNDLYKEIYCPKGEIVDSYCLKEESVYGKLGVGKVGYSSKNIGFTDGSFCTYLTSLPGILNWAFSSRNECSLYVNFSDDGESFPRRENTSPNIEGVRKISDLEILDCYCDGKLDGGDEYVNTNYVNRDGYTWIWADKLSPENRTKLEGLLRDAERDIYLPSRDPIEIEKRKAAQESEERERSQCKSEFYQNEQKSFGDKLKDRGLK